MPKAIINLKNIEHNIKYLNNVINTSQLFAVIKANGYGHGLVQVAKLLCKHDVFGFCVATEDEVLELIDNQIAKPILHLGKIDPNNCSIFKFENVRCTVNDLSDIAILESCSKETSIKIKCHIKVDTGMNRMGLKFEDFKANINSIMNNQYLEIEAIYSHLACSNDSDSDQNIEQIEKFKSCINIVSKYKKVKYHLLSTSGIFNYNDSIYDFARLGLSIYGASSLGKINENLKPAMELKAPVKLIKNIKKGESIGYGATYTAQKDMKVAIIQYGYADGLPLSFSNNGYVEFENKIFPILGRVSMDLTCIEVDETIKLFDEVTLWGSDNNKMRLETLSEKHNTIPYVFLTNLSKRVKRVYINE